MYKNNSQKPKNEYTPRKWRQPPPFKKSTKTYLPVYSIEELRLLSSYFEDSIKNRALQNSLQSKLGSSSITHYGTIILQQTVSGRFQSQTPNQSHTPTKWSIDYCHFKDISSFHKLLKSAHSWIAPFKISFKDLPLHIGKLPPFHYRRYWYDSVVSWRLQIGR